MTTPQMVQTNPAVQTPTFWHVLSALSGLLQGFWTVTLCHSINLRLHFPPYCLTYTHIHNSKSNYAAWSSQFYLSSTPPRCGVLSFIRLWVCVCVCVLTYSAHITRGSVLFFDQAASHHTHHMSIMTCPEAIRKGEGFCDEPSVQ